MGIINAVVKLISPRHCKAAGVGVRIAGVDLQEVEYNQFNMTLNIIQFKAWEKQHISLVKISYKDKD